MEAAAYRFPNTVMGVILGTGTNAAYIEDAAKLGKPYGTGFSFTACVRERVRALQQNPRAQPHLAICFLIQFRLADNRVHTMDSCSSHISKWP